MLRYFSKQRLCANKKNEIKNSLKHHQLISLFYDVKLISKELSLITEIEETTNEEFDV